MYSLKDFYSGTTSSVCKNPTYILHQQLRKSFEESWKSDNMRCVSTSLKCVLTLAVVFGILYVLISPLPEVDATFSGKFALSHFILITHAFLGLFFLTFFSAFPSY